MTEGTRLMRAALRLFVGTVGVLAIVCGASALLPEAGVWALVAASLGFLTMSISASVAGVALIRDARCRRPSGYAVLLGAMSLAVVLGLLITNVVA
jgi:hypothetical protein